MSKRGMVWALAIGLALAGLGIAGRAGAAEDSRYFPQTGHTVKGRFLQYWEQHGGLAQQGYPLTEEMPELSDLNGQTYTVQYFERAVFEYHPNNAPPYDVLLSQLGRFRYNAHYAAPATPQPATTPVPPAGGASRYFPQTGHTVKGRFLQYWQQNGGVAQQGYPLTDEIQEVSDVDGKTYTMQYFERAVFEYHPENQPPYDVLLSLLGRLRYQAKYGGATNPTPTPTPVGGGQLLARNVYGQPTAAGSYIFWTTRDPQNTSTLHAYDRTRQTSFVIASGRGGNFPGVSDGTTVVWYDGAMPGGPGIGGYDLATGRTFAIYTPGNPPREFAPLAIYQGVVYFQDTAPGPPARRGIYAHVITTGQETQITPGVDGYSIDALAVTDGALVWAGTKRPGPGGQLSQNTLFLHRLAAGAGDQVITNGLDTYSIVADGDHVAWGFGSIPLDGGISVYTLSTGRQDVISLGSTGLPRVHGNYLVWTQIPDDVAPGGTIVLCDLRTLALTPVVRSDQDRVADAAFSGDDALVYTVTHGDGSSDVLLLPNLPIK